MTEWTRRLFDEGHQAYQDRREYDWAFAEVAHYFEKQPQTGSANGDRFDVLSTLIEAYENKHYPIQESDPVTAIKSHMDLMGFDQSDLAELLGSRSRASEILSRKRTLTLDMISKLSRDWHMPADVLIQSGSHTKDAA